MGDQESHVQPPAGRPGLIERTRRELRLRHYSPRTERVYLDWIRRYVLFLGRGDPARLGAAEVNAFLTSLVRQRGVSASTQNQARAALLFLYEHVLQIPIRGSDAPIIAKLPERLPVVLARAETISPNYPMPCA